MGAWLPGPLREGFSWWQTSMPSGTGVFVPLKEDIFHFRQDFQAAIWIGIEARPLFSPFAPVAQALSSRALARWFLNRSKQRQRRKTSCSLLAAGIKSD